MKKIFEVLNEQNTKGPENANYQNVKNTFAGAVGLAESIKTSPNKSQMQDFFNYGAFALSNNEQYTISDLKNWLAYHPANLSINTIKRNYSRSGYLPESIFEKWNAGTAISFGVPFFDKDLLKNNPSAFLNLFSNIQLGQDFIENAYSLWLTITNPIHDIKNNPKLLNDFCSAYKNVIKRQNIYFTNSLSERQIVNSFTIWALLYELKPTLGKEYPFIENIFNSFFAPKNVVSLLYLYDNNDLIFKYRHLKRHFVSNLTKQDEKFIPSFLNSDNNEITIIADDTRTIFVHNFCKYLLEYFDSIQDFNNLPEFSFSKYMGFDNISKSNLQEQRDEFEKLLEYGQNNFNTENLSDLFGEKFAGIKTKQSNFCPSIGKESYSLNDNALNDNNSIINSVCESSNQNSTDKYKKNKEDLDSLIDQFIIG